MGANLTFSEINLVVLAEVTASLCPKDWVLTSGKAITYQVTTAENVTACLWNRSTSLTVRSTINDVEANAGSWALISGILYVSAPATFTPFTGTVTATVLFYWSNKARIYNNQWYDPRLLNIPALSLRLEPRFGGVGQVGGGDMRCANVDKFFDSRTTLQWDNGAVTIKVGADRKHTTASYSTDFSTLGTWSVEDWSFDEGDFTLKLKEIKNRLRKSIPYDLYPDGKTPKQIAYGRILGAKPHMVSTLTYQVAGHAIFSFDGLRAKFDEVWAEIPFATRDAATATFTIDAAYADMDLSVDFSGKKNADGTLMQNAVSIIEDLLAYVGETNLATASFTEAKSRLKLGTDLYGKEVVVRAPTIFIDKSTDVLKIIGDINTLAGSYLFNDANGQYYCGVYEPMPGETLTSYSETEILQDTLKDTDDNKDLISKCSTTFQKVISDDQTQIYTFEVVDSQYRHGEPAAMIETITIDIGNRRDAQFWTQRKVYNQSRSLKTRAFTIPWIGALVLPGTHVRITFTRNGLDEVMEVLEVKHDLLNGKVSMVCGDCRSYANRSGFWVANADTLPSRYSSLTGYGAGSLAWNASWHATLKTWAKQNSGFWEDANGFANTSDATSSLVSIWT